MDLRQFSKTNRERCESPEGLELADILAEVFNVKSDEIGCPIRFEPKEF